ncbi:hypothetical protein E1A91_D08G117900v1 [Gossypium mustelinum]|uniref:Uncharacterized protein n=1 Tax=Gossypium mustelinum TaxID=34275 RepID=A0A5D2TWY9_GOSMU|nr:hypothetical protein E1A91_D08G117900v1 [Gossypium mustelinum]
MMKTRSRRWIGEEEESPQKTERSEERSEAMGLLVSAVKTEGLAIRNRTPPTGVSHPQL